MNAEGDATRCHYRGLVKMEKVIGLFRFRWPATLSNPGADGTLDGPDC